MNTKRTRFQLFAETRETLAMALASVLAHKLRSVLTLVGVTIGVFAIVVVMTAIRALQQNVEKEIAQLGAHTFRLSRWPTIRVDDDPQQYLRRRAFRYRDAEELRGRATLAQAVGVLADLRVQEASSRHKTTNPDVRLTAASSEGFSTRNWELESGRGFHYVDIERARRVCVLGQDLYQNLFPNGDALHQKVKFDGIPYTVVGILQGKGSMFGQGQDNFLAIPITTGLNRYGRNMGVSIEVQASSREAYQPTVDQVRGILRQMRQVGPGQPDDFEIISNDSVIEIFRSFTFAIRAGAAVISSIALVAAGVGIMNIMLVAVTERTREIGIRRAVGAKRRNILNQFIVEAVVLCELGGVTGVILGVLAGNFAAYFLKVPPVLPVDWMIIGLVICSLVGIVFGTYPALKASRLDPIESLRYE